MLSIDKIKILLGLGIFILLGTIIMLSAYLRKKGKQSLSTLLPFYKNEQKKQEESISYQITKQEISQEVSQKKEILTITPPAYLKNTALITLNPKKDKQIQANFLLNIKQKLPVDTEDFQASYSSQFDKIILFEKTPKAKESFFHFLVINNLSPAETQKFTEIFAIEAKSQEEVEKIKQSEEIIQKIKEQNLLNPHPTPTPYKFKSTGEYKEEQSLKASKSLENTIRKIFQILSTPAEKFIPTKEQTTPPPKIVEKDSPTLKSIIDEVSRNTGVPSAIIEAVLRIENPAVFNLPDIKIAEYSQPGNYWPDCRPNVCSATGPMQMTIGIDSNSSISCSRCCWPPGSNDCLTQCPNQWSIYGNAVNVVGGYSHTPNPCNIRDNIYAGALKLKTDSGARDPLNWTKEQVFRAAERYYGNCTLKYKRLGNRTYCEYVWDYYQSHQ